MSLQLKHQTDIWFNALAQWFESIWVKNNGGGNVCTANYGLLSDEVHAVLTTPAIPIIIIMLYFIILKYVGPKFMENQDPFEIDTFISIFNRIICILHFGVAVGFTVFMIQAKYSVRCQPVLRMNCGGNGGSGDMLVKTESERMIAYLAWCFYILKVAQLTDGFIHIMRQHQITSMHLVHHCSMIALGWMFAKYLPGGTAAILATINCLTIICIFGYYEIINHELLEDAEEYLPSSYTIALFFQWTEFGTVTMISSSALGLAESCGYPGWASSIFLAFIAMFAVLAWHDQVRRRGSTAYYGGQCCDNPESADDVTDLTDTPSGTEQLIDCGLDQNDNDNNNNGNNEQVPPTPSAPPAPASSATATGTTKPSKKLRNVQINVDKI